MRGKVTILDVARRARVAVGTVSNVLTGAIRVSEQRRERVLKAVNELGYSQNLLAQGLRKNRSTMVGLCVPHTSSAYFGALVNAFEDTASDQGFELLQVLSRQDSAEEYERIASLLKYKIGGLILVPSVDPSKSLELLARSGTPTVLVDRARADDVFDNVTFENRSAMFEATRRIVALGHRRILFIVRQKALTTTRDRMLGLNEAARKAPTRVNAEVYECTFDEVSLTTYLSLRFRKPNPPTAIIVSNSLFAAWTLRAFRSLRIDYPRSVSLLVFDEPDWADLVTPTLSVVRQPTDAIARRAWEFLIRRMSSDETEIQSEQLKAELIFRESIVAIEDRKQTTRPSAPVRSKRAEAPPRRPR